MSDRDHLSLTANARLDGREELIKKLKEQVKPPESPSDSDLILCAYQAWGEDCVKHLIGDFAFALLDRRRQRLFCARDHFGVKPFFFSRAGGKFIFSSALNELRLDPAVSNTLNEIAVGDYLLFGVNQDLSTTIFKDIQRLAPGHSLTLTGDLLDLRPYWTPTISTETRLPDRAECLERFSELLSRAVADRMRSVRIAVLMSGGLDSTSVAAIARRHLGGEQKLHAFTVVYDSLIPDQERHYSNLAASHLEIPITHLSADRYSLFEGQLPGDMDQAEPFLLSPLTGQFNDLLRLCAEFAPVALTGWDGDAFMYEPQPSRFRIRSKLRRLLGRETQIPPLPEWIDESFAARTDLHERWQDFNRDSVAATKRRFAQHALNSKIWTSLFEGYDPVATKLALEVRHPLIDVRLVEFLLSLPPVPWFVNKHILRAAMKDQLPSAVLQRRKTALASDPALQLARRASVRWLDSFEVNPQLRTFVNLKRRRSIANEETSEHLWSNLRVFALNYWLTNSQPAVQRTSPPQVTTVAETNDLNRLNCLKMEMMHGT